MPCLCVILISCNLLRDDICFLFQAEDGIRDLVRSRGLGDVYKRQLYATDPEGFRVIILAPDGTPVGQFGVEGNEPGQFLSLIHI